MNTFKRTCESLKLMSARAFRPIGVRAGAPQPPPQRSRRAHSSRTTYRTARWRPLFPARGAGRAWLASFPSFAAYLPQRTLSFAKRHHAIFTPRSSSPQTTMDRRLAGPHGGMSRV